MQIGSCIENTAANRVVLRIIDIEEMSFRVTKSCVENTLTLTIRLRGSTESTTLGYILCMLFL